MFYQFNNAPQGWICPVCKRVYAPFVSECSHCGKREDVMAPTTPLIPPYHPPFPYQPTTPAPDWWKEKTTSDAPSYTNDHT